MGLFIKESIFSGGRKLFPLNLFALIGANSFLYEMTPIYIRGNNENDRAASPEIINIHLEEEKQKPHHLPQIF